MTKPLTPEVRARIIAMVRKVANDNQRDYWATLSDALFDQSVCWVD